MPRAVTSRGRTSIGDVRVLIDEVLAAFFDLRAAGQRIGVVTDAGAGAWGLLRSVAQEGPVTMADLARRRSVSRQYIQRLANELIDGGWLRLDDNPENRRSGLLTITPAGRRELQDMGRRIDAALLPVAKALAGQDLQRAAETVAALRRAMVDSGRTVGDDR
ncbi:MAG: MarR family winged helix-turn-helix transcriptional regulator [Dehalococcoidia bacterium]